MYLSTSEPPAGLGTKLSMQLHLAVCPDCRAFRRQLEALAALARQAGADFEGELPSDFEKGLVERLVDEGSSRR